MESGHINEYGFRKGMAIIKVKARHIFQTMRSKRHISQHFQKGNGAKYQNQFQDARNCFSQ